MKAVNRRGPKPRFERAMQALHSRLVGTAIRAQREDGTTLHN